MTCGVARQQGVHDICNHAGGSEIFLDYLMHFEVVWEILELDAVCVQ